MAEIVISIVAKVAELLVVPVGKHICYPFKYKTNMAELKEQFAKLTDARDRVQHDIDAAERRKNEIENDVKNWMNSVDEFTKGIAKHIIDNDEDTENKAKKLCSIGFCPNLMARYSLSKKAEKTAKDGVKLLQERKFEKVSNWPDIQRTRSNYIRGYTDFDSRTPIFQDIMQTLAEDKVNIIGVHGMGGVGKTTLVKRVVEQAIDDKLFDVVVMADVTQTPDIQKIQAKIADVLSLKFERDILDGRAAQLRDRLQKEKSVLLVLDDLWKKLDLQVVGIPFWEGGNTEQRQCKLLLTSRDLHLLRDHMNTQKNFQLKLLSDEEAGNLFWQTVGDSATTSDLDTIGVEIIRRCAGLPVAIATIASALKNKSPSNWKDALDQLKKSNPRHIEGMEAEVYSAIKSDYDFLPSVEAKSVFLLCSLYNASFDIDIDYLLQYCIGLGMFQRVSTMEQARNWLQTIIYKLKASNLLLDGNTNMCVKMHDIVHAVAISIASEDKLMFNIQDVIDLKETLEEKLPKDSIAMSLPFKDVTELPERLEFPKLELLVLLMEDTSLQIPDPFFEGIEGLKVLHLNEFHMLSLPSSLCRLTSLQTLRLNQCLLGDIAVIGVLKRIEILSFHSSSIEQLPRDLSQLTRLRLLDLRDCSKLKVISPNLISSLIRLEELYIGDSFVGWDVEGRSNASLVELKQLSRLKRLDIRVLDARIIPQDLLIFGNLESYIIYIGDVWNRFDYFEYSRMLNSKSNYFESSRMLKLKLNDSNIYLGNDFRLLLNRAEDLYLDELKGVKNVVCQLDGEGFPQLKHLYVRNAPEIQYIIRAVGLGLCNVFPKLESLSLTNLINLKKICDGQLAPESFNKLRIMKVENCDTLNHLFSFSMVKNLSQLEEIEVTNCKKLEEIISKESEERVHQNDRISWVEFTQLHTLTLRDLPWLKSFVFHSCTPITESQEIVSEDQPRGFMSLFSQNLAFLCLKELKLDGLPKLLHLWKEDSQPREFFANLTDLDVSYCENLKTLGPSSVPLEKLKTLTVQSCNGLKNLMTLSTAKTLVQLKEITIEDCRMLEEIITDVGDEEIRLEEIITDVGDEEIRTAEAEKDAAIDKITLSMLNSITLDCLPNLITFHSGSNTLECPSLTDIYIRDCPKMETFVFPNTKNPSIRSASLFNVKVGFPSLEKMVISGMDNLESIWHNQFLGDSFSFPKLKSVEVNDCQELKTIFPSCICGRLLSLESLTVKSCGLVEEIFDLQGRNLKEKHSIEITTQLRELYVDHMSNLKHIWNEDPKGMLSYQKLQKITVFLCPNLENLFPASVAKSLLNLVSLDVSDCGLLEEIIAKGGVKEAADRLLFPKLSSLQLHKLPQLRTFYTGQTVEVSCLKRLRLHHCDKVKLFISEFLGFYETIELEELQLSGKAITMKWLDQVPGHVFRSLKSLELNDHESTVLPLDFIQSFGRPEKLSLNSSSYKEIFSHGEVNERPQIKHLVLSGLFDLKQIWKEDSKIDLNFQKLEILEVRSCFNLKNLMPSSASFKNLMILEVWGCEGLKNLLTSSTAKSLVLLEKLEVFDCKMLIEVVANEGAVTEEINFRKLKSLSLMYLQSLASFCSMKHILNFPILESLVVNECPKMKIFSEGVTSTPKLHKLELNWEAFEQSREVGVNTTIKQNMEKR